MEGKMEKDPNDVGVHFQQIVSDIKSSFPLWEDFTNKAVKFHASLRCTISASTGFLDAFQKLADSASGTRGATTDIGSSLTRLCFRHRAIETRLKNYTTAIAEFLVTPLQERMDDWKKAVVQLEKDRTREYKKCQAELKKASQETIRLQKKVKKGKNDYHSQLEEATKELNSKVAALKSADKNSVELAQIEQRSHLCLLINHLKPVVDHEIAMICEAEQLKEIIDNLSKMAAAKPSFTSRSSEELVVDANRGSYCSTLDRKIRNNALKEDADWDLTSNSSGSLHASQDALSGSATIESCDTRLAPTVSAPSMPAPSVPAPSVPASSVDRSQSISNSCQNTNLRPSITADSHNPLLSYSDQQGRISVMSKSENPYAVPTTIPYSTGSLRVVDKIYSRPALVINKEGSSTLKRVMTPTVPSLAQVDFPGRSNETTTGECLMKNNVERHSLQQEYAPVQNPKDSKTVGPTLRKSSSDSVCDEMMSLANALRELEASTALLDYPYEATSAKSCQSLQCSSGYGTLTNTSSVETISSNPSDLDALADALRESCNFPDPSKYSTLPSKSQAQDSAALDLQRPASVTGVNRDPILVAPVNQRNDKQLSPMMSSYDPAFQYATAGSSARHPSDFPTVPSANRGYLPSHVIATSIQEDDVDDLPLPPPPEDFDFANSPHPQQGVAKLQTNKVHSDVMQSLNEKLAVRKNFDCQRRQMSVDVQRSSSMAAHDLAGFNRSSSVAAHDVAGFNRSSSVAAHDVAGFNRSSSMAAHDSVGYNHQRSLIHRIQGNSENVQHAGEPEQSNFEHMIQRGVKLRHTICNDRSAPRVLRH